MQQRPSPKPPTPNWAGLSKNLALWLLVLLLCVALFNYLKNDHGDTGELTYTEFSKQLEAGNLKRKIEANAVHANGTTVKRALVTMQLGSETIVRLGKKMKRVSIIE